MTQSSQPSVTVPELVRLQHGPLASAPLTVLPTSKATRMDRQPFRFCRRLHLPVRLSMRTCRCGRQHDIFCHHRAACAVAQECCEAGARVSTNVPVRDLVAHNNLDGRRLEVIDDGLTLWHGAQLAMHDTCIAMGLPELEQLTMTERSWLRHVGDKNELILNCQARVDGIVWWVSRLKWVARGCETAKFLAALADAKAQSCSFILQNRVKATWWSAVLACSTTRAFTSSLLD